MAAPPNNLKIYHIVHVETLKLVLAEGRLVSDRTIRDRGGSSRMIGMSEIKRRRMEEIRVPCHQGTHVGDYVPFYFCPRSVMLYVIHRANHPGLTYRDGQGPIVHMEADLSRVLAHLDAEGRRWAFSLSNAGAYYAEFRATRKDLRCLDWDAIHASDFRSAAVKEAKQAEFLVHGEFPLALVDRIGVHSEVIRARVSSLLASAGRDEPRAEVLPSWYDPEAGQHDPLHHWQPAGA